MMFGCMSSPVDLRDYKLKKNIISAGIIPDEYSLNFQHRVKNQNQVSSCVAHATSSILEYYSSSNTKLSTNFIYGIRHKLFGDTGKGMTLRNACKIVTKYGDMTYKSCSGNTEVDDVFKLAEDSFNDKEKLNEAYKFKAKYYLKLSSEKDIKYFLMNHGPVLISVKWYDDYKINNEHIMKHSNNSSYGLHALMVYGWNTNGWLCQNSWGSKWGFNGLCCIPYTDGFNEAYGLIDDKDLSDDSVIVKPTYGLDIVDRLLRILNYIIAKVFTKRD